MKKIFTHIDYIFISILFMALGIGFGIGIAFLKNADKFVLVIICAIISSILLVLSILFLINGLSILKIDNEKFIYIRFFIARHILFSDIESIELCYIRGPSFIIYTYNDKKYIFYMTKNLLEQLTVFIKEKQTKVSYLYPINIPKKQRELLLELDILNKQQTKQILNSMKDKT